MRVFGLLDDQIVPFEFDGLSLNDFFLNSIFSDEPVDIDWVFLADSMSSIHGLEIHLWVPVAVVNDDCVGAGQVDTQTTGSCGEQEDEFAAIFSHELFDLLVSGSHVSGAINSAILMGSEVTEVLQDVEDHGHL